MDFNGNHEPADIFHFAIAHAIAMGKLDPDDLRKLRRVCKAAKCLVDNNVERLCICGLYIGGAEHFRYFPKLPNFPNLRRFRVDTPPKSLPSQHIEILGNLVCEIISSRSHTLEELGVGWWPEMETLVVHAIAGSAWPALSKLDVRVSSSTDINRLQDSLMTMRNLRSLDLDFVNAANIAGIASAPCVPQLTRLLLRIHCFIGRGPIAPEEHIEEDAQVSALAALLERATSLIDLQLHGAPRSDFFADAPLENLEMLTFSTCIGLKSIMPIIGRIRPKLRDVEFAVTLFLPQNEMAALFSAGPLLPNLEFLYIRIDTRDDWTFLKNINLPNLQALDLMACDLPSAAETIAYLSESAELGGLANLRYLTLESRIHGYIDPEPVLDIMRKRNQSQIS